MTWTHQAELDDAPGAHRSTGGAPALRAGLSAHETAKAEQVARRLHAELRGVADLLPPSARGASSASRALGLDRATCQRVIAVVTRSEVSAQTLVQLPGVQGLRQFIEATSRIAGDRPQAAERIVGAVSAIDRFESLLDELGGSQRRLKERLVADDWELKRRDASDFPNARPADDSAKRESLFHAAAELTGRWSSALLQATIVQPWPNDPKLTEGARLQGLMGHRWRDHAIPLELGQTQTLRQGEAGPAFATLDASPASGITPGSLLSEFCSNPPPRVISRAAGDRAYAVIDSGPYLGEPLDIVAAHRATSPDRHPATLTPAVGEIWCLPNFPAQRLVFDVFLHRDISSQCTTSLELHLWKPDIAYHGAARWSSRFPGGPALQALGIGAAKLGTDAYPRYAEMMNLVFSRLRWPIEEFEIFRCEVDYPLWRGGYVMLCDFGVPAG